MAVVREPELERESAQVVRAAAQRVECGGETKSDQVLMERHTDFGLKHVREMEGRRIECSRDDRKRMWSTQGRRENRLGASHENAMRNALPLAAIVSNVGWTCHGSHVTEHERTEV